MTNNPDHIQALLDKLELLLTKQNAFAREINDLRAEIEKIKDENPAKEVKSHDSEHEIQRPFDHTGQADDFSELAESSRRVDEPEPPASRTLTSPPISPLSKGNLEKYIGENLTNKIGIIITILGVAIGAKFAIDHQLVSPLTRIIIAYLFGLGLMGFALKLKKNYTPLSSVLLSGSMAILYFVTYSAYAFYGFIPQVPAFLMMLIFTVFTVAAAIMYNRQVIAQIGLVGAYAIPFLLSDGSGKIIVLFSYMTIINAGILFISFKKYWKPLYYSSFGLSWLIFLAWYLTGYREVLHFAPALVFLFLFFVTFYTTFLSYKLVHKEIFKTTNIVLLLVNSFIFYGIGYSLLNRNENTEQLTGLFTLGNALLHFIVSMVVFRQKMSDRNLYLMISGLAVVFITLAVPVQLDGSWVTLLWTGEAALLFWIGRTKQAPVYEKLAYPLMLLGFASQSQDWFNSYGNYLPGLEGSRIMPLLNIHFLSTMLFVVAFVFIAYLERKKDYPPVFLSGTEFSKLISSLIPAILLFSLYMAFYMEIDTYWDQVYKDSGHAISPDIEGYPGPVLNQDLKGFNTLWLIHYSLLFVSLLAFFNIRKFKDPDLGRFLPGLLVLGIGVFLVQGLSVLADLRYSYLDPTRSPYHPAGIFHIGIRYVSFAFVALSLFACYLSINKIQIQKELRVLFDLILHGSLLWIASSELIHWMDMAGLHADKLGLSILWGSYSLLLISLGIWKVKKHLRFAAILVFGVTLVKLFLYDLSDLDTIAKTVVFVSLGILLLIISYLYTKYRNSIEQEQSGDL